MKIQLQLELLPHPALLRKGTGTSQIRARRGNSCTMCGEMCSMRLMNRIMDK